ncbi:hypothetical protein [Salibacterium aidingense]|uniref:hypothetical protein n=1 Tax=Salibacterium aidingense TaxID=384933 RepID=UPI000406E75B|nr:hypothetical protein [Salibacterium aidingense]
MLLINPALYELLAEDTLPEDVVLPESSRLPGRYVQEVTAHLKNMPRFFRRNRHMLTCRQCGHRAKYNIGQPLLDYSEIDTSQLITQEMTAADKVQFPFYFRCENCNTAGEWDWSERLEKSVYLGVLGNAENPDDPSIPVNGESRLFDDYKPTWTTDGEEHLLHYLRKDPENAFLWYKLGILYYKGHRADLAAAALEQAVKLAPDHTEALYTLAQILDTVNLEASRFYFVQVLLSVHRYAELDPLMLRDVAAHSLWELEAMKKAGTGSAFPTAEDAASIGSGALQDFLSLSDNEIWEKLEHFQNEETMLASFYPLAELFLGSRIEELEEKEQTWHHLLEPERARVKQENLETYKQLRQTGVQLHTDIFSYLVEKNGPHIMRDMGEWLGVPFEEDAVFDRDVITDAVIYENRIDGKAGIHHYQEENSEEGSRNYFLEQMLKAEASLFDVKGGSKVDGTVCLTDLLTGVEREIIDTHFSVHASAGDLIYARLLPFEGFSMTSGVFFLFPSKHHDLIVRRIAALNKPAEAFREAYRLYRKAGYGGNADVR